MSVLIEFTGVGVVLIGLGAIARYTAPVFGYRLKRLGLQVVGACLILISAHALLLEIYGPAIPAAVLIFIYALIALMLLQGFLNRNRPASPLCRA